MPNKSQIVVSYTVRDNEDKSILYYITEQGDYPTNNLYVLWISFNLLACKLFGKFKYGMAYLLQLLCSTLIQFATSAVTSFLAPIFFIFAAFSLAAFTTVRSDH